MKKVITIVTILVLMVSMTGCNMIYDMMSPKEIPTIVLDETDETEETEEVTESKKKKDGLTRTEFGEDGKLAFTEHNYLNIGIYAHDGVSAVELSGVHSILNKIITPEMSDVERIKAVHDWLVKNTTYVENYYELDDSRSFIYNLIFNKIAICQGYAVTFYVMMTELGIPCTIVSGEAGVLHAWNAVKLDGKWYYVDVTWDDPILDNENGNNYPDGYNMSYQYLLCTYEQISKTHSEDDYRPNQPSPKGEINSYNDLVYELAGYKGVYRINDEDDATEIAFVIEEPGRYMIYVDDGMDVENQAEQIYLLLKIRSVIKPEKGSSRLLGSDSFILEIY